MTRIRRRSARAAIAASAAALILAGCAATEPTPSESGFARAPNGPTGPFSPVAIDGVAACESLTLNTQAGGDTDTSLPCLTGRSTIAVDALGGRTTVVNLWASWCSVCRKEMPVLQAAALRHTGDMQFVGVDTLDEPGPAAEFIQRTGVNYPQLYDQQGQLLRYTRVPGLPVTLLLDANGVEIARHVGELTAADLEDLLNQG